MSRRILRQIGPFWRQILLLLFIDLLATPLLLLTPVPLKIAVDSVIGSDPLPGFVDRSCRSRLTSSSVALLFVVAIMPSARRALDELQSLVSYVMQTRTGRAAHARLPRQALPPRPAAVALLPRHAREPRLDLPHPVRRRGHAAHRRERDPVRGRRCDARLGALRHGPDRPAARAGRTCRRPGAVRPLARLYAARPPPVSRPQGAGELGPRRPPGRADGDACRQGLRQGEGRARALHRPLGPDGAGAGAALVHRSGVRAWGQHRDRDRHGRRALRRRPARADGRAITTGRAAARHGVPHRSCTARSRRSARRSATSSRRSPAPSAPSSCSTRRPTCQEKPHARRLGRARGAIEFRDVSFGYDGQISVLRDISFGDRAGHASRHRRPDRRRQDDAREPDHALLRSDGGSDPARRGRPARLQAGRPAQPVRDRAAGAGPVLDQHRREHRLRAAGRPLARHHRRRRGRQRARVHPRAAGRLRHGRRRARACGSRAASASASPSRARS